MRNPSRIKERILDTPYLLIALAGILGNLILLLNPGYFSHDEWQVFYLLKNSGTLDYFHQIFQIPIGGNFGIPFRPISLTIMFLQNQFFLQAPAIVHAFSIAAHIANAMLIHSLVLEFSKAKKLSLIASLIFLISPLAVLAVGWAAALMDVWFVFFMLVGIKSAARFLNGSGSPAILILVSISSALSFLSKETGVFSVLALLGIIINFQPVKRYKESRIFAVILAWILPVIIYVGIRSEAIFNSLSGQDKGPYETNFMNIFPNLYMYFAFPFLPHIGEADALRTVGPQVLFFGVGAHLVLCYLIAKLFGGKAVLAYLFGYFCFLVPVSTLGFLGSHYLYASGIALSLMLAGLYVKTQNFTQKTAPLFAICLLVLHAQVFQWQIFKDGACMKSIDSSLIANLTNESNLSPISVSPDIGSPAHVLSRYLFQRTEVGEHKGLTFVDDEVVSNTQIRFRMDKNCKLYQ